jgi:hypothetical protein
MKKKLEVIVEKADDGQLWGRIQYGEDLLTTNAKTIAKVIRNFQEQFEAFYEMKFAANQFDIKYDLEAFFEQYNVLNISEIGKRANINPTVMRRYKAGIKYPSKLQVENIQNAIHMLAKELEKVKIA